MRVQSMSKHLAIHKCDACTSTHQGKEKELKQHLNQAVTCSLSNAVVTGTFKG